jgi:dihydrofolate reductase
MGSLTVAMFMTLDGRTETADGQLIAPDWSGELQRYWSEANTRPDQLMLYGRKAFEFNAVFWPGVADDPDATDDNRATARLINVQRKAVVSSTLREVGWNARLLTGPFEQGIRDLKAEHDGEIIAIGGIGLVSSLVASGLVDLYRLLVTPRIEGGGRSIFDGPHASEALELVTSRALDTGSMLLEYRPRS